MNASNVCRADTSEFVAHSRWTTPVLAEAGAAALGGPNKPDTSTPVPSPAPSETHGKAAVVPEVMEGCPAPKIAFNAGWEGEDGVAMWVALEIAQIGAMIGGLLQQRRPLPTVLDALCRLFDAAVEGCFSSVLLVDRTRTRVRRAIGPGLPSGYSELLEGQLVGCVAAPSGMLITRRIQAGTSDVISDLGQRNPGWPTLATTHALETLGSSPIFSLTGELVGIFAIYWREAGSPKPCAPALLQEFSNMAGMAIERTRTEEALKRSEAQLARAQQLSSTGSFSWRPATDEIMWSEELYRIFELDPAVPVTLDLIRTRVHPEDDELFRAMADRAQTGSEFECEHRLRMSDYSVKYVRLVAHGTRDEEGQLEYIGAVQDVTLRRLVRQGARKGASGARTCHPSFKPRYVVGVHRARSQPAAVGYRHQRQHLSKDARCRTSRPRRSARNSALHNP